MAIPSRGQTTTAAGQSLRSEQNLDGRYIPYSGGCMGWFENGGILKCELPNDYKFNTVLDPTTVRRVLFARWGDNVNRRVDERTDVENEVRVSVKFNDEIYDALSKDLSAHGLRLQILENVENLEKGQFVTVSLQISDGGKEKMVDIDSQVMWVARVGTRRAITNVGIGFTHITDTIQAQLKRLLLGA